MSEPCSECYLVLTPYCPKNIILLGRNSREPSLMECAQEVCYFDADEALDDDKVNCKYNLLIILISPITFVSFAG